jgi:cytochrome c551/c552
MKPATLSVMALLAGGACLTAWGISGAPISDVPPEPTFARTTDARVVDAALVQRGAMLQQQNCAGCHRVSQRVVGPRYLDIARRYRQTADPRAGIAAAILHPSPRLAGYPPGPSDTELSITERGAIAEWILDLESHREGM